MTRIKELQVLRMRLKSGEYDGVHIMHAWLAIDELIELKKCIAAKPPNQEVANVCPKCGGNWRGDGVHQNEFCEKCFADKPGNAELIII